MSKKAANKPRSGTEEKLADSSDSLESTIEPSEEFLQIYKSSYAYFRDPANFTKKQIRTIETKMDKLHHKVTNSRNATLNDIVALTSSYHIFFRAHNKSNKKGELREETNLVLHFLSLVRDKELHFKTILVALKGYYALGTVYAKYHKLQKAVQAYDKAVELYLAYTQADKNYGCPIDFDDFINELLVKVNGYEKLHILYQLNLKFAVTLYKIITPVNNQKLMAYRHLLLIAEFGKILETNRFFGWIVEAMSLSNDLVKCGRFSEASSHINAAMFVKRMHFKIKYNGKEPETIKLNELDKSTLFLFTMYYTKYGLALMRTSAKRLFHFEKEQYSAIDLKPENSTSRQQISQRLLLFSKIGGFTLPDRCQPVAIKYVTNYNEAQNIFTHIMFHLQARKSYFNPDIDVKTYMQFILDTSSLYKYMTLFEKSPTNLIVLHNRYINLLSGITKKEMYSKYPGVLKGLLFQLAIGCSNLVNVKLEILETTSPLYMSQRHDAVMLEIKHLMEEALANLKLYMFYK